MIRDLPDPVRCQNGEVIPKAEYIARYRAEAIKREEFWAKRNSGSPFTAPLLNEMAQYMASKRWS